LLRKQPREPVTDAERLLAKDYWEEVAKQVPDWERARTRSVSTAELRQNFIHAHGIALHALGIAGASLLTEKPKDWKVALKRIRTIDWLRSNTALWEGRAMIHGRISKVSTNIQLTAILIKKELRLSLTEQDKSIEKGLIK
jgi:DNA sulfur modification protein DndB